MIEISNLSFSYGERQIFRQLRLKAANGKCYAVYGAAGCGKSTFAALLAGGIFPQKGAVRINGFDTLKKPESARRSIGYMPQEAAFYGEMTVYEFLDFMAGVRNVRDSRRFRHVHAVLEVSGLEPKRDVPLSALTPFEKRILAFAQTLIGDPEILILDEPAEGLSKAEAQDLYAFIGEASTGKTLFITTSSPVVAALCDEIILIRDQGAEPPVPRAEFCNAGTTGKKDETAEEDPLLLPLREAILADPDSTLREERTNE